MSVIIGTEKDFDSLVEEGTVIVDFFAEWCGPCKMIAPILKDYEKNNNVKVVKIDVDKSPKLAEKFQILSIPTLHLFKNGESVSVVNGFMANEQIDDWIKKSN